MNTRTNNIYTRTLSREYIQVYYVRIYRTWPKVIIQKHATNPRRVLLAAAVPERSRLVLPDHLYTATSVFSLILRPRSWRVCVRDTTSQMYVLPYVIRYDLPVPPYTCPASAFH